MKRSARLITAFVFVSGIAMAQPTPEGGGVFILEDEFDGPPNTTNPDGNFWAGSCGSEGACDREDIGYVRDGAVPGMDCNGEWEHWPSCCEPGGGSGSEVNKDGNGNMTMQMLAAPWQSYVDNRCNSVTTDNSHSYTVICIITLPSSGGMFFGYSISDGAYSIGVKMTGGRIFWTNADPSDWGNTAADTDTGATYTAGTPIGVAYHIETDGAVSIHTSSPPSRNALIGWTEVANLGAGEYAHQLELMSIHTIVAADDLTNDLAIVDYLAWIEDSPKPFGGVPVNAVRNWTILE